jgi:competence protein ComEC
VHSGSLRLLLTGDVEPEAQQALLRSGADLRADVLKVPHHGSRYQEPDFLKAVGADVAVVSVGADNDYGHPAQETLRLLRQAGTQTRRTDLDGDVAVVVVDGRLHVETRG